MKCEEYLLPTMVESVSHLILCGMNRVDATLLIYGTDIIHLCGIFSAKTKDIVTSITQQVDAPLDQMELKIYKINMELLEFMLKKLMDDDINRNLVCHNLKVLAE